MSIRVWFTDFWHEESREAIATNCLYQRLNEWLDIALDDQNPTWIIHSCFGSRHLCYPNTPKLCFLGENKRPNFQLSDRIIGFDFIDNPNYLRLPLYRLYDHYPNLVIPKDAKRIAKEKNRFCAFVVSNKSAHARIDFFHKLNQYKKVDSGGRHLNNVGGPVADKLAFLKPYKFSIAFENSSHPGYSTEKLTEAMASHTIPIYWGDPRIAETFNPESFINVHHYASFDEVIEHVIALDQDDEAYLKMLQAPVFYDNKEPPTLQTQYLATIIEDWLNHPPKQSVTEQHKTPYYWKVIKKMVSQPKRHHYLIQHMLDLRG